MEITQEWLEKAGFKKTALLGMVKELAVGPGHDEEGTVVSLCIGYFPFNALRATLYVGGIGVSTGATCCEDIEALIRLLEGAQVDHPEVAWIDGDDE